MKTTKGGLLLQQSKNINKKIIFLKFTETVLWRLFCCVGQKIIYFTKTLTILQIVTTGTWDKQPCNK